MKLELNLYASLGKYKPIERAGKSWFVDVPEGTTVKDLLILLKVPIDDVKLIFLNGVRKDWDQVIHEGDRLGVFPPVAGG